ncbi:hypothetical protein D3C85_1781070 [compost metagenome]
MLWAVSSSNVAWTSASAIAGCVVRWPINHGRLKTSRPVLFGPVPAKNESLSRLASKPVCTWPLAAQLPLAS